MLADKYRPETWEELIGQKGVVGKIAKAIARATHGAWLFTGPSGSGKTSAAFIVARQLAECEFTGIHKVESRTCSLDSLLRLEEDMAHFPFRGKWKVYIIDEVHSLTKGARDFALGLLERIPPYRLIVGTSSQSAPFEEPALMSRWTQFRFSALSKECIAARIREIARTEGIEPPSDWAIERLGGGQGNLRAAINALGAE